MKPVKKILALILAGVMALALLTGCGKATSLNRTMAEGIADYETSGYAQMGNTHNISVSYQVPELRRDIAPLFDENWITKKGLHGIYDTLSSDYTINGKSIEETLRDILRPYISADSAVTFLATDVTDVKTPFLKATNLASSTIAFRTADSSTFHATSVTSLKIEVTHKTVKGRTYALAVLIAK